MKISIKFDGLIATRRRGRLCYCDDKISRRRLAAIGGTFSRRSETDEPFGENDAAVLQTATQLTCESRKTADITVI